MGSRPISSGVVLIYVGARTGSGTGAVYMHCVLLYIYIFSVFVRIIGLRALSLVTFYTFHMVTF